MVSICQCPVAISPSKAQQNVERPPRGGLSFCLHKCFGTATSSNVVGPRSNSFSSTQTQIMLSEAIASPHRRVSLIFLVSQKDSVPIRNVRFFGRYWGYSRHGLLQRICLLMTQSGHGPFSMLGQTATMPWSRALEVSMRRREFITLVGGAAAWPMVARAQQNERVRRIGVLVASPADDAEWQARLAAFNEGLTQLGWIEGRNVRVDTRWATTNADDLRKHAAELAATTPDVLFAASGTSSVAPLLQATRTVPIVFAIVVDPVGARFCRELGATGRQRDRIYNV